jgi:hypothetical protein
VLTHVLSAISECDNGRQLAFKGGTALRLCHLDSYRYSADLDFSLIGERSVEDARASIQQALLEVKGRFGFPSLRMNDASPPRIEYVGPLGAKPRLLKLDLATDELVENTEKLPVVQRYSDQTPCECLVYTLEEITAEKLRCVIQRLQCRDLYDLNELLVIQGVDAESIWPLFERKAWHRKVDPHQFAQRFSQRVPEWKARWARELPEYIIGEMPDVESVLRAVRRELRFVLR